MAMATTPTTAPIATSSRAEKLELFPGVGGVFATDMLPTIEGTWIRQTNS